MDPRHWCSRKTERPLSSWKAGKGWEATGVPQVEEGPNVGIWDHRHRGKGEHIGSPMMSRASSSSSFFVIAIS